MFYSSISRPGTSLTFLFRSRGSQECSNLSRSTARHSGYCSSKNRTKCLQQRDQHQYARLSKIKKNSNVSRSFHSSLCRLYDFSQPLKISRHVCAKQNDFVASQRLFCASGKLGTVNDSEVDKFSAMSSQWWDPVHNPLIGMNVIRLEYIRQSILKYYALDDRKFVSERPTPMLPLNGMVVLDIGCGGGLLSESLARLGAASVTAIDPSIELVNVAKSRAAKDSILSRTITYRGGMTAEQLLQSEGGNGFDVVFALEVIEHVANPQEFLESACALLRPGGLLFVSTINRTPKSFLLTIIGAEYIMKYLPRGTHNWNQYFQPEEIQRMLRFANSTKLIHKMEQVDVTGMVVSMPDSPLNLMSALSQKDKHTWDWKLDPKDTEINWIGCYKKALEE